MEFIPPNSNNNKFNSSDNGSSVESQILAELKKMNMNMSSLTGNMRGMSQTNFRDGSWSGRSSFRDSYNSSRPTSAFGRNRSNSAIDTMMGEFTKPFTDGLKSSLGDAAKSIDLSNISGQFGKSLSKNAMSMFRDSNAGKAFLKPIDNFQKVAGEYTGNVAKALRDKGLSGAITEAKTGFGSVAEAAKLAGPHLAAVAAAMVALEVVTDILGKDLAAVGKAANEFNDALVTSMRREHTSGEKNRKEAQKRLEADIETMVKTPFKILEDAAQKLFDAWDSNIKLINQTQGYTKSDLASLLGNYAERLRGEGLSGVISAADLTTNLGTVLKSGLSGKVAEEFAYQATLLNNAIPSQDFFSYASTYASVAANLIKNGASQDVAIQKANESLTSFASSLLYASRELSGGFSTGLQNASDLYNKAVNISIAARTNNPNQIAGVLSSVAAITGSTAPDLASSLVDAVYQAATGGNSDNLVALRSLAGINASNTEFLRAFATNPQQVFANIFTKLANMYNQTPGAFMEAAEGYSSIFGLSRDAFARVDFNYLAKAISTMNTDNSALADNIKLLQSGQSTLTKEQLRNQQINEYMIEEGLAYVLDSEAGRLIQQHMWDEQIAREMQETTYGVDLRGKAIELLSTIGQTIKDIVNLLNPFAWGKVITQPLRDLAEANALEKDIAGVLEATKVGGGNATALRNLLTRNADLQLTPTLIELLGGTSRYRAQQDVDKMFENIMNYVSPLSWLTNAAGNAISGELHGGINSSINSFSNYSGVTSRYAWGTVGKSAAAAASALLNSGINRTLAARAVVSASSDAASKSLAANIDKMLAEEYLVDKFVKQGKTYEEFAASASSFGISDFDKALEEVGYSKTDIQGYFSQQETKYGGEELANIRADEKDFRDAGRQFWREDFWKMYSEPLFEQVEIIKTDYLQKIIDNQIDWKDYFKEKFVEGWMVNRWDKQFWQQFNDYFFEHKIYNGGTLKLNTLEKVQKQEKAQKGDVANALSEYLTKNNQNLEDLKDPTIQTNMLLSQILVVCNGILNQTARTEGAISLSDSISALANGLIKQK